MTLLKKLLLTFISSALKDSDKERHLKRWWADVIAEEADAAAVLASARAQHAATDRDLQSCSSKIIHVGLPKAVNCA